MTQQRNACSAFYVIKAAFMLAIGATQAKISIQYTFGISVPELQMQMAFFKLIKGE